MSDVAPAKKSLGQHWLNDDASLEAICECAGVRRGDTVLEIGPGQGSLTAKLLARGALVVAVELDERLAERLQSLFKEQTFILNMLSILDFDLSSLPANYKIVANIPYYLTAHLLRLLCETPHKPDVVALLVQKEVAQRVAAAPGNMSVITVSAQLNYEVSLGPVVPARLFIPAPKVDSQVLVMHRRTKILFADIDTREFYRIVKAGFANRRKTLMNSLSAGLHLPKAATGNLLDRAGIKQSVRAQELSLNDWYRLYSTVNKN